MKVTLGYILSRSLYVATELGIADLLQDGGPKTIEELSSSTGAHPKSLYRLLRTTDETSYYRQFYSCLTFCSERMRIRTD
jgi:Dimerisation domain